MAPVNRTERSMSDSTSFPDAGASDPEDRSWSFVMADAIVAISQLKTKPERRENENR
jgi:hypothetical protein